MLKADLLALVVAPYTGAWIEITIARQLMLLYLVAPYTGAWIDKSNL